MNWWSIALTHLLSMMFADYARLTAIEMIFGIQARNMRFFRYFWVYNIFIYAMLVILFYD